MNRETTLGFIGLGYMGSRLAKRLLEQGYRLRVFNRNHGKAAGLVHSGAIAFDTIAERASDCDVILSCVANDQAAVDVYEGAAGCRSASYSVATAGAKRTHARRRTPRAHTPRCRARQ